MMAYMTCVAICIWLYTVFVVGNGIKDICPHKLPCTCSVRMDNRFVVNCSSMGLQAIPAGIPGDTTDLMLSSNNLTVIENYSFVSLARLAFLDLGYNSMKVMQASAFQGLSSLDTLLLNNNKLNALTGSYPPGLFQPLERLRVLDIRNNVQCDEKGAYPSVSLSVLSSLEELRLDVIEQRPLPADFGKLTNLTTVHFQPDSRPDLRFCCFKNLSKPNLAALNATLETLVYRGCSLIDIELMIFEDFSVLKTLLFEGTPLHSLAPELAYAVSNSNIEKLYLNNTGIGDQAWSFITGLQDSKVTSLMFDTDYIYNDYHRPPSLREILPGLQELSLGDNYLSWTSDLTFDFLSAPNLRYLNLSWQQREHVTSSQLNQAPIQPQHYKLWNTPEDANKQVILKQQVPSLLQPAVNPPVSHDLQLTDTELKFMPEGEMDGADNSSTGGPSPGLGFHLCGTKTICPVIVPKHLELIDISHNGLHLPQVPNILIMNKNNLKTLIMSNNRIAMLPKKMLCWNFSMNMETIDLSQNQINHLVPDLFGRCDFTSMKHFLFSWNLFGQMCTTDQDMCHFLDPMPYIETVDLSTNEIHQLPSTFLSNHSEMRRLVLTNNSLQDISFNVSHMHNLQLIDLTLNKLTCVSAGELTMIHTAPNATIRLVGNLLSCTCSCLHFIQWVFRNKHRLVDPDETECTLKNGTKVYLSDVDIIKRYLEDACVDLDWAWTTAVGFFVYCLLTIVVSLTIRFQWELRYSIYRLRMRMGRYETCTPEGPFRYDAFMAFHENDFHWVRYKAISALEEKAKLQLCVHKRDFLPGNAIVDNICDALNGSKKIVIALTDSFLQSGWCQFEFKMAHSMSIDRGRNLLIFVILKKLHKRKITEDVMHILNAYTYLEWPEDALREGQFWTRLEEAIREQPPSVISA